MQLSIMNRVKSGELSIEDALNQARKDRKQLLKEGSLAEEVRCSCLRSEPGHHPQNRAQTVKVPSEKLLLRDFPFALINKVESDI